MNISTEAQQFIEQNVKLLDNEHTYQQFFQKLILGNLDYNTCYEIWNVILSVEHESLDRFIKQNVLDIVVNYVNTEYDHNLEDRQFNDYFQFITITKDLLVKWISTDDSKQSITDFLSYFPDLIFMGGGMFTVTRVEYDDDDSEFKTNTYICLDPEGDTIDPATGNETFATEDEAISVVEQIAKNMQKFTEEQIELTYKLNLRKLPDLERFI